MKKTVFFLLLSLISLTIASQPLDRQWIQDNYTKREVMISMRDGVKLGTAIYEPRCPREGGAPIILTRTPYGTKPYGEGYASDLGTQFKYYVQNGYIIVYQSVRGTFLSEGEFENVRPVGEDPADVNDSYDTIEWLIHNTPTNGRVGIKGVSYPGFYATVAALCGHPALKAVSPQAPVTDWFLGDDFGHNGEVMMIDSYRFGSGFLPRRTRISTDGGKTRVAGTRMTKNVYKYFLDRGSLDEVFKPWADTIAFWNGRLAHPTYDNWWAARNPVNFLKEKMPAMMVVGGLYDAEDCYGAFATYRGLVEKALKTDLYFVEGPWYHGGYRNFDFDHLDYAWFGQGIGETYFRDVEYPFFAYYLEDKGVKPAPVQVMPSAETMPSVAKDLPAENRWIAMESWPEAGKNAKPLRMKAFSLSRKSYVTDPDNPVPYYHKVFEQDDRDKEYMAGDQRGLENRGDVATWRFETLADTLALIGPVHVHLRLSQTCDDASYIVKIIDERPDGYQMLVRGDVMPTRFRYGFDRSVAVKPGKTFDLDFDMPDIAHFFMPGHRVIIQIQSSWFPLVARRPATCETMTVLPGSCVSVPLLRK